MIHKYIFLQSQLNDVPLGIGHIFEIFVYGVYPVL